MFCVLPGRSGMEQQSDLGRFCAATLPAQALQRLWWRSCQVGTSALEATLEPTHVLTHTTLCLLALYAPQVGHTPLQHDSCSCRLDYE